MPPSLQPASGTSADTKRHNSTDTVRPNGSPGKPLRILLVEDSPLLRSRLESMLSQYAAFKVTGLASAEAREQGNQIRVFVPRSAAGSA